MLVFENSVSPGAGWLVCRGGNSRDKGRNRRNKAESANVDTLGECIYYKKWRWE